MHLVSRPTLPIQSDTDSYDYKIGGSLIFTALTTLTLLGNVFLILAHQGVPLGSINSFANMIPSQWICVSVAVTCVAIAANSIVIGGMMHSLRKSFFSQDEIRELGISQYLEQENILEKMAPNSYWLIDKPVDKRTHLQPGSPPAYAIVIKDPDGTSRVRAFATDQKRRAYLSTLDPSHISGQYLPEFAEKMLSASQIAFIKDKENALIRPNDYVVLDCFAMQTNPQNIVYALIFSEEKNQLSFKYFATQGDRSNYISTYLSDYRHFTQVKEAIFGIPPEMQGHKEGILHTKHLHEFLAFPNNAYTFEMTSEEISYFLCIYRDPQSQKLKPIVFPNPDSRALMMEENQLDDISSFINSINHTLFEREGEYDSDFAEQLLSEDQYNLVINQQNVLIKRNDYSTLDCYTLEAANSQNLVYVLTHFDEENQFCAKYFATENYRRQYISTHLIGFRNLGAINQALFGVPEGIYGPREGIVSTKHLDACLVYENQAYTFELTVDDNEYFLWIYRDVYDNLKSFISPNAQSRQEEMEEKKLKNITSFVNSIDHGQLKEKFIILWNEFYIDLIIRGGEYWIEENFLEKTTLIVLQIKDDCFLKIFPDLNIAMRFVHTLKLKNARTRLQQSNELTEELGIELLHNTEYPFERLQLDGQTLLPKEYKIYPVTNLKNRYYPRLLSLVKKDVIIDSKTQEITYEVSYHFFRASEDLNAFVKLLNSNGYRNNDARIKNEERFLICVGNAIREKQKPSDYQPIYYVLRYPNFDFAHLMVNTISGTIEHLYDKPGEINATLERRKDLIPFKMPEWQRQPLTQSEKQFLEEVVFAKSIQYWITEMNLQDNHVVKKRKAHGYVCLMVCENGQRTFKFYKNGDRKIRTLLTGKLKAFTVLN